jgi:hypothetical protein
VPTEDTDSNPLNAAPPLVSTPASALDAPPNPELLSALGRLARGLSVLFWGLPIALVVCVQSAKGDWFRPLGVVPPMLATGLLLYGLTLLGHFQKQERVWIAALDRAKVFALINLGASPFLYWWNRIPSNSFFGTVLEFLTLNGLLFLFYLNPVLHRLTSMLPDETLRLETRMFSALNRYILFALFLFLTAYFSMQHVDPGLPDRFLGWLLKISPLPARFNIIVYFIDRAGQWIVLFLVLLPLAMIMALLWKIKEVILASVFGPDH